MKRLLALLLLTACHRPIDATWAVPNTCAPAVGDRWVHTYQSLPHTRCMKRYTRYTCTVGKQGKRKVRAVFCVPPQ